MKFRTFLTLLLLASYFLLPAPSHAQMSPEQALEQLTQTVSINMSPEYPGPNSNVNISIESFSTDLDTSKITWSVDGVEKKSGLGVKNFSLQTGASGKPETVSILIEPQIGNSFIKTVVVQPGEVDLLWQGKSYTPPFYKGRSLWSNQGQVILFAVPHTSSPDGTPLRPSNLIYRWSKDGTVLGSQSGAGKNSITLTDSVLSLPQTITVEVLSDANTIVGSKSIRLASITPSVLIYEDSPLYGPLFNREVGEKFVLGSQEVSFSAFPLFFSTVSNSAQNISYSWGTNNVSEQPGSKITFRAPSEGSGSSNISLKIDNTLKLLQGTQRSFLVQFGSTNNL
ncbi:MAG: hypothetical protein ACYC1K_02860 [Minisyncoccota bacterium]